MMGLVAFAAVFLAAFRYIAGDRGFWRWSRVSALIRTIGVIDLFRSQGLRIGRAGVAMVFVWSLLVATLIVVLTAIVFGFTTYFAMAYAFIVDRAAMHRTGPVWLYVYDVFAVIVVTGATSAAVYGLKRSLWPCVFGELPDLLLRSAGRDPLHRRTIA